MFLDEVIITAQGGGGGRGSVSWRREKYVPKGGPDGGNGGNGGNVCLTADENTDTLSAFASQKRFTAEHGKMGSGKKCHGRDGDDLVLKVPPGTLVYETKEGRKIPSRREGEFVLLADLEKPGDQVIVAHGGRGGYGNAHFVNSYRQRPDFAELGEPGEERSCKLELKLIADIGIIGLPNVGKSTLIAAVSSARPRIADYPFTTLIPNLGVVKITGKSYIVCDIPGLIEGAARGKGLGNRFLRHIERCGLLVHLLDCTRGNSIAEDYRTIRTELAASSPLLAGKKELVVLNKTDILPQKQTLKTILQSLKQNGIDVFCSISAATRNGTEELKKLLLPLVLKERGKRSDQNPITYNLSPTTLPILRPHQTSPRASAYQIERKGNTIHISGKRIEQIVAMTDTKNASAVRRLLHILERIGIPAALRALQLSPEHRVYIGKTRIDPLL
ncbi:GTPase ObgE [Candidatus Peregrinibacteria bacterium]|nr:GTPase ObgE [Candidatus Peregrinibacteria bacterium]